jgi:hypothetical protein
VYPQSVQQQQHGAGAGVRKDIEGSSSNRDTLGVRRCLIMSISTLGQVGVGPVR